MLFNHFFINNLYKYILATSEKSSRRSWTEESHHRLTVSQVPSCGYGSRHGKMYFRLRGCTEEVAVRDESFHRESADLGDQFCHFSRTFVVRNRARDLTSFLTLHVRNATRGESKADLNPGQNARPVSTFPTLSLLYLGDSIELT